MAAGGPLTPASLSVSCGLCPDSLFYCLSAGCFQLETAVSGGGCPQPPGPRCVPEGSEEGRARRAASHWGPGTPHLCVSLSQEVCSLRPQACHLHWWVLWGHPGHVAGAVVWPSGAGRGLLLQVSGRL